MDLTGRTLSQHYKVTERIGGGGMGEVYRARDTTLGRDVAIKVVHFDRATDPSRVQRFEREARMLASLNHPNIATVHGFEESDGIRFLVMELVEGETLSRRIETGPIQADEVAGLFSQIADALEAAHDKGIIHRDLKPANVMITPQGRVKVLDFGLAKAFGPEPAGAESNIAERTTQHDTQVGTIVGTLAYMSPEQARGKDLDTRTDVWSFGCVLYEALTGSAAFLQDSAVDTIARVIERDPDWSRLPTGVSASTRRTLQQCLEKEPDKRPQTIAEVRSLLESPAARIRWPWIAAILIIVAVAVAGWWMLSERSDESATTAPVSTDTTPVVAVGRLTNLTGDADLGWIEEGLAALVRDRLAESRHVAVVSRSRWESIARTATQTGSIAASASEAGIDCLVSGEFLSARDGLILTARVTDVGSGEDLVARTIGGLTREGLLDASDRLALLVKEALKIPHTEKVEVFAADFAADHPAAYEALVAGLEYFARFAYRDAEQAFRSAIALEPGFYMARYRLAHVLAAMGRTDEALTTLDDIPETTPMSKRERYYLEGARALFARDYDTAKRAYSALLEEFPYEVEARQFLAEVYDLEWDDEAALEQILILVDQEPENPTVWVDLGETYLRLDRFHDAGKAMQRYLALLPEDPHGYTVVAKLLRAEGDFAAAAKQLTHALEIDPGFHPARLALSEVYVLDGNDAEAARVLREILDDEETIPAERIDAGFDLSSLLRARGRFEESAALLEGLETELAEEEIREAKALAVRGLDHLELGEPERAAALIDRSILRSPTVPTRYLFARGLLELQRRDIAAIRATAAEIRSHALPPEEQDFTEAKVAAYLEGVADVTEGNYETAIPKLREAVTRDGYDYALYELGLAVALSGAGRHAEAEKIASEAVTGRQTVHFRLDLELDRARALLVEAQIHLDAGETTEAKEAAGEFLTLWSRAPQDHPDVVRAREIARGS